MAINLTKSSIPKGGIFVPSKTGTGGTYFIKGQGYSVLSDPNKESPITSTVIKSSGGGRSTPSAPIEIIQEQPLVSTPSGVKQEQTYLSQRQEQIRKAQEAAKKRQIIEQLRGQSRPSPFRIKEEKKVYTVYDPRYGGVITSEGKFYATKDKNWRPKGTIEGQGYSFREGIAVGEIPKFEFKKSKEIKEEKSRLNKFIENLQQKIEQNKVNISQSERNEYYYLGKKNNKTFLEQQRFKELSNKVAEQIKKNNQRVINTILLTAVQTGVNVKDLIISLKRDPIGTIKNLPSSFVSGIKSDISLLKTDPLIGVTKVGTEYILFRTAGKVGKYTKEGIANYLTETLDPRYVGKLKPGSKLNVNLGGGRTTTLTIVSSIPKESLISQVEKAGKVLSATSSQKDSLLKLISRYKEIRKPIPGEEKFTPFTKKLLNKFDKGTITNKELIKLNILIRKQGAKGLLERSFFADPTGKIRPSRLGVLSEEEGGILDYFRRGITFRRPKPQILLFDSIKVESFPPNLRRVALKLKRGISLNPRETNALLKFQLQRSGKFKPVGFITGESELTLAPGEIIKRTRIVGKAIIKGKRVPIIKAEVIKPTGRIKELLNKLDKGRVSKREGYELADLLRKKTGLKYTYSSLKRDTAKYFSLKKLGLSSILYASKSKKGGSYMISPKRYIGSSFVSSQRYVPNKYIKGYIKKPPYYSPPVRSPPPKKPPYYSPPVRSPPPKKPPIRFPPKIPPKFLKFQAAKKNKISKYREPFFDVFAKPIKTKYGKRAKRFIKVNITPLKKSSAEDLRNYITDTSLSRTALIIPSKNKPGKINLNFPKGYAKKTNYKFRGYRIVKGNKIKLKNNRVIEFSRNALDTIPEKKKIDLLRRIQQIRNPRKNINTPKRLIKGSKEARLFMSKIRRMKKRR